MHHAKLFILMILISTLAACAGQTGTVRKAGENLKGSVTVIDFGETAIHTYISPADAAANTTHIIETANALVVVDAQFLRPFAKEAADYARSLGKPVERVLISHSHPDHWFGLEFWRGAPIYALAETQSEIEKYGQYMIEEKRKAMGDAVTDQAVVPALVLTEGAQSIDGLRYEFKKVVDGEAGVQLLTRLPDLSMIIAQDLVYNQIHLFVGQNEIPGWKLALADIRSSGTANWIMPGHGLPGGADLLGKTEAYLDSVMKVLSTAESTTDLKEAMLKEYPEYKAPFLLDISGHYLFK